MFLLSLSLHLAILHLSQVTPMKQSQPLFQCSPWQSSAPINCSSAAISNISTLPPQYLTYQSSGHPTFPSVSCPEQKLIYMIYRSSLSMMHSTLVIFLFGSNACQLKTFQADPPLQDSPLLTVISSVAIIPSQPNFCSLRLPISGPVRLSIVFQLGTQIVPLIIIPGSVPRIFQLLMIFFLTGYCFPLTPDLVSSPLSTDLVCPPLPPDLISSPLPPFGDWGRGKGFGWRLMRLLINSISRIQFTVGLLSGRTCRQ